MPHFVYNYMDQWLPQAPIEPGVHLLRDREQKTKLLCLEGFHKLVVWKRFYLSNECNKIRWVQEVLFLQYLNYVYGHLQMPVMWLMWAQLIVCAHTYADSICFMHLLLFQFQFAPIFWFCYNVQAFAEV